MFFYFVLLSYLTVVCQNQSQWIESVEIFVYIIGIYSNQLQLTSSTLCFSNKLHTIHLLLFLNIYIMYHILHNIVCVFNKVFPTFSYIKPLFFLNGNCNTSFTIFLLFASMSNIYNFFNLKNKIIYKCFNLFFKWTFLLLIITNNLILNI